MSIQTKRGRLSLAVLCTVLTAGAFVLIVGQSSSQAAPSRKNYASAATPNQIVRGVSTEIKISLTNLGTSTATFNAVRLTIPAIFQRGGVRVDRAGAALTTTADGVEILNANVAPGETLIIAQSVSVACGAAVSAPLWATDIRQANNFNGAKNDFFPSGPDAAVAITNLAGPCGVSVTCTAGDNLECATGELSSPLGNVANVRVNDTDTVSGELKAQFTGPTLQCDEYTATSERLKFDMTVTNGVNTGSLTKRVTISQATDPLKNTLEKYYACFQSPDDFLAQLPSELVADFNSFTFTGNTKSVTNVDTGGIEHKGLLLPCAAGMGAPCVDKKYFDSATNPTKITIELLVPVGDPFVDF